MTREEIKKGMNELARRCAETHDPELLHPNKKSPHGCNNPFGCVSSRVPPRWEAWVNSTQDAKPLEAFARLIEQELARDLTDRVSDDLSSWQMLISASECAEKLGQMTTTKKNSGDRPIAAAT